MFKALIQSRWTAQSNPTRIAVSAALTAAAVVLAYKLILLFSSPPEFFPSPVSIHAWMYRHYETRWALQNAIGQAFLLFMMASQLCLAVSCDLQVRRPDLEGGPEVPSLVDKVMLGAFVGTTAIAALLGISMFEPDFFSMKGVGNLEVILMVVVCEVVCVILLAICCSVFAEKLDDCEEDNPVAALSYIKPLLCLAFLFFGHNAMSIAMAIGMVLLDFLLRPAAKMPKTPASGETVDTKEANVISEESTPSAIDLNKQK